VKPAWPPDPPKPRLHAGWSDSYGTPGKSGRLVRPRHSSPRLGRADALGHGFAAAAAGDAREPRWSVVPRRASDDLVPGEQTPRPRRRRGGGRPHRAGAWYATHRCCSTRPAVALRSPSIRPAARSRRTRSWSTRSRASGDARGADCGSSASRRALDVLTSSVPRRAPRLLQPPTGAGSKHVRLGRRRGGGLRVRSAVLHDRTGGPDDRLFRNSARTDTTYGPCALQQLGWPGHGRGPAEQRRRPREARIVDFCVGERPPCSRASRSARCRREAVLALP
jgi:hypothetical protein